MSTFQFLVEYSLTHNFQRIKKEYSYKFKKFYIYHRGTSIMSWLELNTLTNAIQATANIRNVKKYAKVNGIFREVTKLNQTKT